MASFLSRLFRPGASPAPIPPGIYHWATPGDAPDQYRLHLRIEPDGSGLLLVNAAIVLHLNSTAAAHAKMLVDGLAIEAAAAEMVKRYNVRYRQALEDQRILRDQILTLATNPDVDPVVYLGLDREDPYDRSPTAPYRVDLALTYRCDETGAQDILARKRVDRELTTEEWAHVIDTLWQAGVPHLTFTGGEATLRPDLIDLIKHAEANGQVTGLLSDGKALSDRGYVEQLALAGLDHLLITWDPSHPESLAGLREALVSDIFTGVHLTLSEDMLEESDDLLQQLRNAGVTAVSISARETLQEAELHLAETRQRCADLSLDLIWELPVPFTQHNPIRLEVADSQQGAGRAWLYVEPDGDVLPAQGIDRVLGNLTRDSWEQIWSSAQSQPAA